MHAEITYSTELNSLSEVTSRSATKKFPNILWKLKVHQCVYKSPPPFPILSKLNPVRATPPCFVKVNFNIEESSLLGYDAV
jgi:hypothetical protein